MTLFKLKKINALVFVPVESAVSYFEQLLDSQFQRELESVYNDYEHKFKIFNYNFEFL